MKFAKISNHSDIVKLGSNKTQTYLEDWVMHLSSKKLKATTITNKLSAIELFLEMNKITFHKKALHKLIPSSDYIPGGKIPYTSEDISKMLQVTIKLRTKALIHFLASTGSRPGTIEDPPLRMKHLLYMPHDCAAIKLYDGSNEGYWAFLTPEATKALKQYFSSRILNGKQLNEKSPIFANWSPYTVSRKNDFLSTKAARSIISTVVKRAGIDRKKEGHRFNKATTYGFRKRFNTILKINSDVNSNIAEKLMAHKNGLDGKYFQPTREECFKEFLKAVEQLTIDPSQRQQVQINQLEQEKSEIEKLQNDINYLKERLEFSGDFRREKEQFRKECIKELEKMDPEIIRKFGIKKLLKLIETKKAITGLKELV